MTKQRAIYLHCLECAGGSAKEVTLCHLFDCPLWPYRTGQHVSTSGYKARIDNAFRNYPEEFEELARMGIDLCCFRCGNASTPSMQKKTPEGPTSSSRQEEISLHTTAPKAC
jgi:hypothetical protein